MKRAQQKFKYAGLIDPCIVFPDNIYSEIEGCTSRIEEARTACRWVASHIEDSDTTTDIRLILLLKKGTCLGKCALAVSLLRNLGFSIEEVFVTILVKKGENPFEALHASVYFQPEEIFFDLTDGFHEYNKTLEDILSTYVVVLMFNDEICLVPY
jgi:hypothetical protein